jgi:outer membrane murein-binding lipoprotein Lpp
MNKPPAILLAFAIVSLLTVGGCATVDDISALRSDIASLRPSIEAADQASRSTNDDINALRSDIASLRPSIEAADQASRSTNTIPPAEYQELRSDITALRASIEAADQTIRSTSTTAVKAGATIDSLPAGYQRVSTLVKLPEFVPGLGSLYVRPQTLPAGPFLAYDRENRLVSTIYMIPMSDIMARKTFEHLNVGDGTVQDIDLYYNPGHPGVEAPHYHVVLWHVPEETAKLQ